MTASEHADVGVHADDVSITYREHGSGRDHVALSGATFDVARGGILGVVGTAGSGKTALGRALSGRTAVASRTSRDYAGWPRISGGRLVVGGIDLRFPSKADSRRIDLDIGYLAQNSGDLLRNDLTIAENIAEPILSRDRSFDRRRLGRAAAMLIDAVGLELGMLNKFPFELSRGQRQRIAFAQALIVEPSVLVVDEPAQGVDILARPALFTLLERINRARACTMVLLSHDLATVERLTNDILVLDRGVVLARGHVEDVLEAPEHPYLRRMKEAREYARAPLPGMISNDTLAAMERVADGLFGEIDAVAEQAEAESKAREALIAQRPEFARFAAGQQPDAGGDGDERGRDA